MELRNSKGDYYLCPDHPACSGKRSAQLVYQDELKAKGTRVEKEKIAMAQAVPNCPKHKTPMVLRMNSRSGNLFYGCAKYPKCRETEDEARHAASVVIKLREMRKHE